MNEAIATITPYRDGPLLVRGSFRLQDSEGREIPVERQVVALCRCGKSRIRPLCDGSHKLSGFRAPSGQERRLQGSGERSARDG
ncbi:MAG: CDGSH iron-sulfur domain-containing protein [Solirubrobacterales bacterium]|nr:CDGSH iron-sulfur domain-containing protein [Solirubrobacterales bacterium]MBV9472166.1 CDGSH iron-sulfur domain-containing protein [Solirubrobacterales bacterium]MBV9839618.1 CDGSH iron-sulfur domain-containing protein [Solirubrobacterales bacterium]